MNGGFPYRTHSGSSAHMRAATIRWRGEDGSAGEGQGARVGGWGPGPAHLRLEHQVRYTAKPVPGAAPNTQPRLGPVQLPRAKQKPPSTAAARSDSAAAPLAMCAPLTAPLAPPHAQTESPAPPRPPAAPSPPPPPPPRPPAPASARSHPGPAAPRASPPARNPGWMPLPGTRRRPHGSAPARGAGCGTSRSRACNEGGGGGWWWGGAARGVGPRAHRNRLRRVGTEGQVAPPPGVVHPRGAGSEGCIPEIGRSRSRAQHGAAQRASCLPCMPPCVPDPPSCGPNLMPGPPGPSLRLAPSSEQASR